MGEQDDAEMDALLAKMAADAVCAELRHTLRELESLEQWADIEADKRRRQRTAAREQMQKRYASDRATWDQLLAEFAKGDANGRWRSLNAAARELETKYGFAESTIRKRIRKPST